MKLILVFSPGRVGTAYLSQVFGGDKWSKRKVYIQDKWLIGHEFWSPGNHITFLKKNDPFSEESIEHQIKCVKNDILKFQTKWDIENIFCTSNIVGRYYSYCLPHLDVEYKIIKIARESSSLCKSFISRIQSVERQKNQKNYLEVVFNSVMFNPTDFTFHKISNWKSLSDTNKLLWYFAECEERWNRLKETLAQDSYLETTYEHIINHSGLEEISSFTGLKYFPELMKIRVNESDRKEKEKEISLHSDYKRR